MTQTLIVGGGLSGLALADMMERQGQDYLLVEARNQFGGRIQTQHHDAGYFDMGPAWFWPHQPRIATLIDRLGLMRFDQFAQGALSYEDEKGHVQRGRGFASMQVSWRLKGGFGLLIDTLAADIPDTRKRLGYDLKMLTKTSTGIRADFQNGETIDAANAVLALPPRIAAGVGFHPALSQPIIQTMQAVPTWMAGQAKAVAVYSTPFWREAGLSGDANSRHGPMVEVHDASPMDDGPYALFGFIGIPPQARQNKDILRTQITAQLVRLFGPDSATPQAMFIKDWATDPHTATSGDSAPVYAHPTYGLPEGFQNLWNGKLQFAGTEVAPQFGGYIEGALEAAENAIQRISHGD